MVLRHIGKFLWNIWSELVATAIAVLGVVFGPEIGADPITKKLPHGAWAFMASSCALVAIGFTKKWLETAEGNGRFKKSDAFDAYSQALTTTIESLRSVDRDDPTAMKRAVAMLLKAIVATVRAQPGYNGAEIYANIMTPVPHNSIPRDAFHDTVLFTYRKDEPSMYATILHMWEWDRTGHGCTSEVYLPVHIDKNQILFGAPRAWYNSNTEHIKQTKQIKSSSERLKNQPHAVKLAVAEYFAEMPFLSFISIGLKVDYDKVGVLTIQSSKENVAGDDRQDEIELMQRIQPFCALLATTLSEYQTATNQGQQVLR